MNKALALLVLLCPIPAAAQQVVVAGQQSDIKEARFVVARTQDEFAALWKTHAAAKSAPAVNFSEQIVVGVFLGQQRQAGTKVKLTLMPDPLDSTKLVVFWEGETPSAKGFAAQVLTTPFELRAVPKRYASVAFERNLKARAVVDSLQTFGFDCR